MLRDIDRLVFCHHRLVPLVWVTFLVLERGLLFSVASNPRCMVPGLLSLHRELVNYQSQKLDHNIGHNRSERDCLLNFQLVWVLLRSEKQVSVKAIAC